MCVCVRLWVSRGKKRTLRSRHGHGLLRSSSPDCESVTQSFVKVFCLEKKGAVGVSSLWVCPHMSAQGDPLVFMKTNNIPTVFNIPPLHHLWHKAAIGLSEEVPQELSVLLTQATCPHLGPHLPLTNIFLSWSVCFSKKSTTPPRVGIKRRLLWGHLAQALVSDQTSGHCLLLLFVFY